LARDEFVSTAQIRNRCRTITVKNLTNILEKMEKVGLITRRTENDKRAPEKIIVKWGLV